MLLNNCVIHVLTLPRFRLSTRTRENSVFKKFHSEERLRKVPFPLIVFIGCVWKEAVSVKKKLRFQIKTDTCGQGPSCLQWTMAVAELSDFRSQAS